MKRKFSSLLAALWLASLGGCVDLDEELVSGVSSTFYETATGLEAAVNAAYSELRTFFGREQSLNLAQMGTDTWSHGDQGGFKYINQYGVALNASDNTNVLNPWATFYRGINNTNAIVERAAAVTGMDPELRDRRIGEARFLRALLYFYLVQIYGDVHLTLTENKGVNTEATRSPAAEVYQTIIADLEAAISVLPTQAGTDWGRATKGAAEHYLAKVHLTRAYKPYAEATDFQRAADLAKSVINTSGRTLLPNFADLFCGPPADQRVPPLTGYCDTRNFNEENAEILFALQYSHDPAQVDANTGNYLHLLATTCYEASANCGATPGMSRDIDNGRPFRRIRPTKFAIDSIWKTRWVAEPGGATLDTRYDATFQSVWIANTAANAAGPASGTATGAINPGDTAWWHPGYQVTAAFRATKRYRISTPCSVPEPCPPRSDEAAREYDEFQFPGLKKYQDNRRSSAFQEDGGKDLIMARLGETYLLAAEALLGAGAAGEAATYINAVRERAGAPGVKNLMTISPADVTLDFILDERERELAGELHRWYDLARTNKLLERVRKWNFEAAANIRDFHVLRPIPQNQIDGTSTPFPQNPGY